MSYQWRPIRIMKSLPREFESLQNTWSNTWLRVKWDYTGRSSYWYIKISSYKHVTFAYLRFKYAILRYYQVSQFRIICYTSCWKRLSRNTLYIWYCAKQSASLSLSPLTLSPSHLSLSLSSSLFFSRIAILLSDAPCAMCHNAVVRQSRGLIAIEDARRRYRLSHQASSISNLAGFAHSRCLRAERRSGKQAIGFDRCLSSCL